MQTDQREEHVWKKATVDTFQKQHSAVKKGVVALHDTSQGTRNEGRRSLHAPCSSGGKDSNLRRCHVQLVLHLKIELFLQQIGMSYLELTLQFDRRCMLGMLALFVPLGPPFRLCEYGPLCCSRSHLCLGNVLFRLHSFEVLDDIEFDAFDNLLLLDCNLINSQTDVDNEWIGVQLLRARWCAFWSTMRSCNLGMRAFCVWHCAGYLVESLDNFAERGDVLLDSVNIRGMG